MRPIVGHAIAGGVGRVDSLRFRTHRTTQRVVRPNARVVAALNTEFSQQYRARTGSTVNINQSHGGSSAQARLVNDGLQADVVTLALWADTDSIRQNGLIADGWENRLPDRSLPYYSTIVFVVRKGNPKQVRDWPDLVKPGVEIITPNPKTSGNGKLSFLAAWGSVIARGGSEWQARQYLTQLYGQDHTKVLDIGARGATTTFAKKNIGDVHITWENEAQLEVQEAQGELELVYPPISIRAEPFVAWVDKVVKKKGTEEAAKAYLQFLYTPEAQATIAKHFYRPNAVQSRDQFAAAFPAIKLIEITTIAKDWGDANQRFFADGAIFDQIFAVR